MLSIRNVLSVLVCGLALALPALSVAAGDPAQGRVAFTEGQKLFVAGDYRGALKWFDTGYEQTQDPAFLLNIAQCHRSLREDQAALRMFKAYLKEPTSKTTPSARATASKAIAELESAATAGPPARAATAPGAEDARSTVPAPAAGEPAVRPDPASMRKFQTAPAGMPVFDPTPEIESTREAEPTTPAPAPQAATARNLRLGALVCGGVGLLSAGTGFYYWTRARSLSDSANEAVIYDKGDYDAGKRAEKMQWIFYGVAGGAVATGVVLLVYSSLLPEAKQTSVSLAPMVGPGAAGLLAGGTF